MPDGGSLNFSDLWNKAWAAIYEFLLGKLTQPEGGIGIVETLGSGYSVAEDRMENVAKLKALGMETVGNPSFNPVGAVTKCNLAARFIAEGFGFFGFPKNALADDMIEFLAAAAGWREDTLERAFEAAQKGGLVFIGFEDHPHGHIVAMAPDAMEQSDLWGGPEPLCYNVGRSIGLMKISGAFPRADKFGLRFFIFEASVA